MIIVLVASFTRDEPQRDGMSIKRYEFSVLRDLKAHTKNERNAR
jgi:hypothetical protein